MATYYYHGAQILAPLSIISNSPIYDADTVSLKKLRSSQGHQRWELSFEVVANDNAADLLLASIENLNNAASMIMPQIREVEDLNTLTGTLVVPTETSANSGTVTVTNTFAITGILKKGTFVKFSNHGKVYILSQDLDMAGTSGTKTAHIFPKLQKTVAATSTLQYGSDCALTYFREVTNMQGINYSDGVLSNIGSVQLIEAI